MSPLNLTSVLFPLHSIDPANNSSGRCYGSSAEGIWKGTGVCVEWGGLLRPRQNSLDSYLLETARERLRLNGPIEGRGGLWQMGGKDVKEWWNKSFWFFFKGGKPRCKCPVAVDNQNLMQFCAVLTLDNAPPPSQPPFRSLQRLMMQTQTSQWGEKIRPYSFVSGLSDLNRSVATKQEPTDETQANKYC